MERTDPLPTKPAVCHEFADRFLEWVNDGRLEEKTRKFYRNGWRLLKPKSVATLRGTRSQVTALNGWRFLARLQMPTCAFRSLRRMLHKAEEGKMIAHAPKSNMMKEHG